MEGIRFKFCEEKESMVSFGLYVVSRLGLLFFYIFCWEVVSFFSSLIDDIFIRFYFELDRGFYFWDFFYVRLFLWVMNVEMFVLGFCCVFLVVNWVDFFLGYIRIVLLVVYG